MLVTAIMFLTAWDPDPLKPSLFCLIHCENDPNVSRAGGGCMGMVLQDNTARTGGCFGIAKWSW